MAFSSFSVVAKKNWDFPTFMCATYTWEVLATFLTIIFPINPDSSGYDEVACDPFLNDQITKAAWSLLNAVPWNSFLFWSYKSNLFEIELNTKASAMSQLGSNKMFDAFTICLPSLGLILWNSYIIFCQMIALLNPKLSTSLNGRPIWENLKRNVINWEQSIQKSIRLPYKIT